MKAAKRCFLILLACMTMMTVTACGSTQNETAQTAPEPETDADQSQTAQVQSQPVTEPSGSNPGQSQSAEPAPNEDTGSGSDILVVYFSRTGEQYGVGVVDKGNTEIVAEMIIEETGADSFRLLPADDYYPYTYEALTDIAKREQNENARPAYAGEAPDFTPYNTIFIGSPVWWGDWPMLLYTFFEENETALAGKTLIPFSTHGGSGLAGFDEKLVAKCPDSTVGTGLAIRGTDAQNKPDEVKTTVQEWIAGLLP